MGFLDNLQDFSKKVTSRQKKVRKEIRKVGLSGERASKFADVLEKEVFSGAFGSKKSKRKTQADEFFF